MVKTAAKVMKTSENSELSHLFVTPVRNYKMMKMHMLPAGPSVLASAGLVSVENGDTWLRFTCCRKYSCGVLAGRSFSLNQNETDVLALEICIQCTILPVEYGSMVWFPDCGGQSYIIY